MSFCNHTPTTNMNTHIQNVNVLAWHHDTLMLINAYQTMSFCSQLTVLSMTPDTLGCVIVSLYVWTYLAPPPRQCRCFSGDCLQ